MYIYFIGFLNLCFSYIFPVSDAHPPPPNVKPVPGHHHTQQSCPIVVTPPSQHARRSNPSRQQHFPPHKWHWRKKSLLCANAPLFTPSPRRSPTTEQPLYKALRHSLNDLLAPTAAELQVQRDDFAGKVARRSLLLKQAALTRPCCQNK